MAKDYTATVATVQKLLTEFGQIVAIRRNVETPGANEWDEPSIVSTDHSFTAAAFPVSARDVGLDAGGALIKSTDLRVYGSVSGLAITPESNDTLLINGAMVTGVYTNGVGYKILRNNILSPAGTPVLYDMIVTA